MTAAHVFTFPVLVRIGTLRMGQRFRTTASGREGTAWRRCYRTDGVEVWFDDNAKGPVTVRADLYVELVEEVAAR